MDDIDNDNSSLILALAFVICAGVVVLLFVDATTCYYTRGVENISVVDRDYADGEMFIDTSSGTLYRISYENVYIERLKMFNNLSLGNHTVRVKRVSECAGSGTYFNSGIPEIVDVIE